jgi:hypothetical protein
MVRNLAAQIEAIWPQEQPIFARHPPPSRILEVGCGIGESIFKLAQLIGSPSPPVIEPGNSWRRSMSFAGVRPPRSPRYRRTDHWST